MIYLDALIVKVRDGAHVRNKAALIAVGVDMDGIKHVLGIWVQQTEGGKFWADVCAGLANRGVKDVLIVCCDGLTRFPEAIDPQLARLVQHSAATQRPGEPPPAEHAVNYYATKNGPIDIEAANKTAA